MRKAVSHGRLEQWCAKCDLQKETKIYPDVVFLQCSNADVKLENACETDQSTTSANQVAGW